jgi:hypothetical protein
LGTQTYKTKLAEATDDNSFNPHWKGEDASFIFHEVSEVLTISCYKYVSPDYSVLIGQSKFNVTRVTNDEMDFNSKWFFVALQLKVTGHIFIEIRFQWNDY